MSPLSLASPVDYNFDAPVDLPPMNILDRINLNPHLDTTLAHQLKQQVDWFIASGQLQPGDILPSVRQVASHFRIHINTVRSAYQKLEADGLVETRQGLGTRVLPYDPQRMARLASSLPSHTVGVIIPSLAAPFYHPFLQGVETVANQARIMLFMCVTHDDRSQVQRYYAQLASKNVDGILLASQDDSLLAASDQDPLSRKIQPLPLVAVDWPPSTGYAVNLDLENAGYQATRHLLEHGHRRIGLITHALDLPNVRPVNAGYQRALREAGIESDPRWIAAVHGFDTTAGAEGARTLMALEQPPSAIFAIADLPAIGAICALQQAGLRVPQDVAVVGFNDIPLAAFVNPPLTTVAAPSYEMGLEAMKMLQSLIAARQPLKKQLLLPTFLVIRQSCGEHGSLHPC
jgi:DNA-binding LacI/PurR family transcriptional regulator